MYALERHSQELAGILLEDGATQHYAITVNALELLDVHNRIGGLLLAYPKQLFSMFDLAIKVRRGRNRCVKRAIRSRRRVCFSLLRPRT